MFLNYAYAEEIHNSKEQGNICNRDDFEFQPFRIFQLLHQTKDNTETEMKLFNCVMFQKHKCDPEWRIVNTFSKLNSKWSSTKIISNHRKFNNCLINFYIKADTSSGFIGILYRIPNEQNKTVLKGLLGEFFNRFAESRQIFMNLSESEGNGTNEIEFHVNSDYFDLDYRKKNLLTMEIAYPFLYKTHTFLITPGTKFSPAENLYMPFDFQTWTFFIISIFIGLIWLRSK